MQAPDIELEVEVGERRVGSGNVDLDCPTRARLVVSIRHGVGWVADVVRNGLVDAVHSSRYIGSDEFCAVIDVALYTSCAIKVACRREHQTASSKPVVFRMESGVGGIL